MSQNHPKPRMMPLYILIALNLVSMIATWTVFDPGAQNRVIITMLIQFLFLPACAIWFLFLSRLPGKTRLKGFVVMVVALLFLVLTVEVRDWSGNMVPILAWRWTPSDDSLEATVKTADLGELPLSDSPGYPQFLGPDGNAMIPDVKLARDWSQAGPEEVWRIKIGAGWSGFAIYGGLAVTQEQRGEEEMVTCYNLEDGSLVWAHSDNLRFSSSLGGDGPRSTPSIDNGMVYTFGATGLMNCLELATGKKVWSRDLKEDYEGRVPEWGYSGSPLVTGNLVIAGVGGAKNNMLVALDRTNGEFVWGGGSDMVGYSTPQLRTLGGVPQIITLNANSVTGLNPETGALIWEETWGKGTPNCANPLVMGENLLLVSSGYGVGAAMLELQGDGSGQTVKRLYETTRFKAKFANYVKHGDSVYGLDDGIMTSINAATGDRNWKKGRYGHGQLLLVGDLILLQSEDGVLRLMEPSSAEHKELGSTQVLGDKSWNNMALSGDRLVMRNHMEAVCLKLPMAP